MKKDIQVSASILCADFTRLGEEVKKCEDAGVDMLHVDVMDGYFVPNITVGKIIVEAIRPITKLPIEVHLMIENPWRYIDDFIDAGADTLSLHAECYGLRRADCREFDQYPKEVDTIDIQKARKDILRIKDKGKKAFMVLNPGTPVCLGDLLNDLDGVLIMSVNPGFAKQSFMPEVLPKIQELRKTFQGDIAIDGGIKKATAPLAVDAGANILATASYFFGAEDQKEAVEYLKFLSNV
jgi:ribulose-phosphate 3-epimerase